MSRAWWNHTAHNKNNVEAVIALMFVPDRSESNFYRRVRKFNHGWSTVSLQNVKACEYLIICKRAEAEVPTEEKTVQSSQRSTSTPLDQVAIPLLSMSSPPINSSATSSASLVATALISIAFGVVSTVYIMKRRSPDVDYRKSEL